MNTKYLGAALVTPLLLMPIPADAATPTLKGVVGPDHTITLKRGGKEVHSLKAGKYIVKVTDKSDMHNFHLKGPGVNKATSVSKVYKVTWKVKLKKGKYRFVCDPHASSMSGSFSVK